LFAASLDVCFSAFMTVNYAIEMPLV